MSLAAALLTLALSASASGTGNDPGSDLASPGPVAGHENRHQDADDRVRKIERTGDGPSAELKNDAKFKQQVGALSNEQFEAFMQVLGKHEKNKHLSPETVQFALNATASGSPRDPEDIPAGGISQAFGLGLGFGAGVTQSAAQPPETKIDPAVLHAVPPEHHAYPQAQFALAVQDQQRGDHRAALGGFETAIGGGQDDARTLTFASLSALNAGDPRRAAAWSAAALQKDPGGALAQQAEAVNKLALKRLPKEEDPLAHPPRRPPESAAAPQAATAVPELDRPLPPRAADPGLPPEAIALLAATNRLVAQASKAYRTGDIKEAVKLAGEALSKDPDDVRAIQVRAASLAKAGRWEEARSDAERGLDLAPGYVPLLLLRAAAAAHAKDWRSVRADAQAVINKESANPTAWRFLGIAQAGLGQRSEALASLARSAGYGDPDAPRLLAAVRSLPPGADVVDLVEMLTGAAAEREAATAARATPPAPARRNKTAVVLGAALLAGLVAGGLILLAGRRDEDRV